MDWVADEKFLKTLTTERAKNMRSKLLEMSEKAGEGGDGFGYSLDG